MKPSLFFPTRTGRLLALLLVLDGALVCGQDAKSDAVLGTRVDRYRDPLPAGAVQRLGTVRWRHHDDSVYDLVVTPDGRTVISVGRDRAIRFWDAATGRETRWLLGPNNTQKPSLALTGDGKVLAAAAGSEIGVWDVVTGSRLRALLQAGFTIEAVAIAPDGGLLAVAGQSTNVQLRSPSSGDVVRELPGHDRKVTALAFSPGGQRLASGTEDGTVRVWDVARGRETLKFRGHQSSVHQVLFLPDGKTLVTVGVNDAVILWDLESGSEMRKLPTWGPVARSRDGRTLAVAASGIGFYDVATGKELRRGERADMPIYALAFVGDTTVVSCGWDSSLRLWDVATAKELPAPVGHDSVVGMLAFLPDGKSLVSASGRYDLTYRIWDTTSGAEQRRFTMRLGNIAGLALAPDGQTIALGFTDHTIFVRDLYSGKDIARLKGHKHYLSSVAFAPDGRTLASGSWDKTVRLWDIVRGNERRCLEGHTARIASVTFSPDGKHVASAAGAVDAIHIWDVAGGKSLRLGDASTLHHSVAFTPDGKLLASQGALGNALWESATGEGLGRFGTFTREPAGLAFAPDGRGLWAVGTDGGVYLWEVATRQQRLRFAGHPSGTRALALSPDGHTLATGGNDTTILLWDTMAPGAVDVPLTAAALESYWEDLKQENGEKSYGAICALAAAAEQSVPILRERLLPIPARDLARLIAELDSVQFTVRERATRELQARGKTIEPVLKDAMARATTLEAYRRLETLVNKTALTPTSPEQLRMLRGIETLERIATPAAREVLSDLARSARGSVEEKESQGALERLGRTPR